jgi:hypothetical protein
MGEYGSVFSASLFGSPMAMKQHTATTPPSALVAEVRLLQQLQHEGVLRCCGTAMVHGSLWLAMEFANGGSIIDQCNQSAGLMSTDELLAVAIMAGTAMAWLHTNSIVHRDIAARNLVCTIDHTNTRYKVKLGDFGLATRAISPESRVLTRELWLPTRWSSPEALQRVCTTECDIWSFGVLLWELFTLCQEYPYASLSSDAVVAAVTAGVRLPQPHACPAAIYQLMLRCWDPKPGARPTADNLLHELGAQMVERTRLRNGFVVTDYYHATADSTMFPQSMFASALQFWQSNFRSRVDVPAVEFCTALKAAVGDICALAVCRVLSNDVIRCASFLQVCAWFSLDCTLKTADAAAVEITQLMAETWFCANMSDEDIYSRLRQCVAQSPAHLHATAFALKPSTFEAWMTPHTIVVCNPAGQISTIPMVRCSPCEPLLMATDRIITPFITTKVALLPYYLNTWIALH